MSRALLALTVLGACVQSAEVVCSDGRLCPPGYTCDDANMRCLSAEQVAACSGREEGAECTVAGAPGACRMGACDPLVCGDGIKAPTETCDGTDLGGATCRDAGFYDTDGLACTGFCTFDVSGCTGFCGDQIVNGTELCDGAPPAGACADYGFDAGSIECGASCGIAFEECARFGWLPESTSLTQADSFAATDPSNIWVTGRVGAARAVAHYNGNAWSYDLLSGDEYASAIATTGPTDAWIIRDAFDATPTRLEHYANGTWSIVGGVPPGDYKSLWALGSNLFLATSDVGVLQFDGTTWKTVGTLTDSIVKIEGTSVDDIFAVGATGTLWHWTGTTWQTLAVDIAVTDIDPVATNDLWVIGASTTTAGANAAGHWDGTQWTVNVDTRFDASLGYNYEAIGAASANDAWVSTPLGTATHFSGQSWSNAEAVVVNSVYGSFLDILAFPNMRLALTFDGFVYRYRGQMYVRFTSNTPNPLLASVSFTPSDTVLIDTRTSAYHYNGSAWTKKTIDATTLPQNNKAAWGRAPDDIWVGGNYGRIYRYDGTAWVDSGLSPGATIRAITGSSATDVWVFAFVPYHYDGVDLTPINGTYPQFIAASASGPSDVWAVATPGASGSEIWHYNGIVWNPASLLVGAAADVVAIAPDNVFVVGENRIQHWDGTSWSEQVVPVLDPFMKVSATGPNDVFAQTEKQLMHFDGARWAFVHPPSDPIVFNRPMSNIAAYRDRVDIVYGATTGGNQLRRLLRTRMWDCADGETVCNDGVDDDCDDAVDSLDTDCP